MNPPGQLQVFPQRVGAQRPGGLERLEPEQTIIPRDHRQAVHDGERPADKPGAHMRNECKKSGLHPVEIHRSIVTTDCPHFGAIKGLEHLPNGVFAENSIGIHIHDELTIGVGGAGVQRSPLAGVLLVDKDHGVGVGLGEVPHHLGGAVGRTIIDHDELEMLVAAGQNGANAGI